MKDTATKVRSGAGGIVSPCAAQHMDVEDSRSPLSPESEDWCCAICADFVGGTKPTANRLAVLQGRQGGGKPQPGTTGYNTRSSKKKQGPSRVPSSTPEQTGEGTDQEQASESTPLMTMTTRSRAHLRNLVDSSGSQEQRGNSEQDTAMQDAGAGGE
eukprot:1742173-Rhodomonas_salina.2